MKRIIEDEKRPTFSRAREEGDNISSLLLLFFVLFFVFMVMVDKNYLRSLSPLSHC